MSGEIMQKMQQEEEKKPQPYKQEVIDEDISYEVQANGDVKVIQKQTTHLFWKANTFKSLIRQNEEALKMFKDAQSEDYKEKMAKQEKECQEVIDKLTPISEESEKKQAEDYIKMRHEGLLTNARKAIADKDTKEIWFINVWLRTKAEIREPVFKELNKEEQSKLLKILQKLKRKGIK